MRTYKVYHVKTKASGIYDEWLTFHSQKEAQQHKVDTLYALRQMNINDAVVTIEEQEHKAL